jgi:hypothetical protein
MRPKAAVAAKRRDSSAQGNALGRRYAITKVALKGRDSAAFDTNRSHPGGVPKSIDTQTQGVALG